MRPRNRLKPSKQASRIVGLTDILARFLRKATGAGRIHAHSAEHQQIVSGTNKQKGGAWL